MTLKYHVTTNMPDKFEERLKVIEKKMLENRVGAVTWKKRGNEFWILINYLTENMLYDAIVKRKLEGRFKKLDKDVKIERF